VGRRQFTQVFSDLAEQHGYLALQVQPDDRGFVLSGSTPGDSVTFQPPILQVSQDLRETLSTDSATARAEQVFDVLATRLNARPLVQLGVRFVYHAAAPEGNARAFVRGRLLNKTAEDFAPLRVPDDVWVGLKLVTEQADTIYTVQIEPLHADLSLVFIDVDAQLPNVVELVQIRDQIRRVEEYVRTQVREYLNSATAQG
jgi:hypothetical protein